MVKERCQKRSFQDTLEDIKKRMKEKRNKNLAEVGKRKSFIVAPCQVSTNTSTLLKYYQDNNRLLVLALENEKSKVREAQDIILQLRRECYYLTCQLCTLKEKLTSRQREEGAQQNWKERPSEVVSSSENMTRDFDNSTRDLSVKTLHQTALEETDCPYQTTEASPTVTPETLGCDFDSGKVNSTDEVLPRTVSSRQHLRKDFSNVSKASSREEPSLEVKRSRCKDLTVTLHRLDNVEQNVYLWNKEQINLCPRLISPAKITKTQEVISSSKPEQKEIKHKRAQKRRAEQRRTNQRCKSNFSLRSKGSKGKEKRALPPNSLGGCVGSSDAYDFNLKERVHHTPFRQKMKDGSNRETNSINSEVSACSTSEGESDGDDPYLPPYKRLQDYKGSEEPVTRPRSKRGSTYPDEKSVEEVLPPTTPTGTPPETQESPHRGLKDVTNSLRRPIVKSRKLSLAPKRHEDSPAVSLRRCTTITSYKEPRLNSKLRRGDPFTDLCFLNPPIFKQKKEMRHRKRTK